MEHRHLRLVDLSCHHGVHRLSATRLSWPLGIHESLTLKSLEQIWNRIKTVSIESIAFSKQKSMFWSILIHFEHGRRSLTTASTLGEAARSSDAIRMAAMLLWKHVETTSGGFWSILIHSAILPRDCARSPLLSPQLPVWVSLAKQPEKHGFSLSFLLLSEYWQTESDFPKHAETHEPF